MESQKPNIEACECDKYEAELEQQIKLMREELVQQKQEIGVLKTVLNARDDTIEKLTEELKSAQEDKEELRNSMNETIEKYETANAELSNIKELNTSLQTDHSLICDGYENDIEKLQREIHEKRQKCDWLTKRGDSMNSEMEKLQRQLGEAQQKYHQELSRWRSELDATKKNAWEQERRMKRGVNKNQQRCDQFECELQKVQELNEVLQEKVRELTAKLTQMQSERDHKRLEVYQQRSVIGEMKATLTAMKLCRCKMEREEERPKLIKRMETSI